jgi:drug/metabolite transporter (DMT)-like permease
MSRFAIDSKRAAAFALFGLTILWGNNWLAIKLALDHADPVIMNVHRTLLAVVALFAVMLWRGGVFWPTSWRAAAITGLFQTTINFGSTTIAVAEGGIGRTSVLLFTMPFWTLLFAWPVLHERVRGMQWVAVAVGLTGLTLVVEPWHWQGSLAAKFWAVLAGIGWAAGTVAIKYFQRSERLDMLSLMTWQMTLGVLPLLPLAFFRDAAPTDWSAGYWLAIFYVGVLSSAFGFLVWVMVLRRLPAGTASFGTLLIPVIALVTSALHLGERLNPIEWFGIALLGVGLVIISLVAIRADREGRPGAVEAPPIEGG